MDNETASILRAAHLRRFAPKLLACILLLLMFSVVFATPAHAGVLEDLGEILKDPGAWLVDKFLRDPAESLLNAYANTMSAFGTENFLTGSFKSLFGNGEGTDAVWTTINAVHKTLIVPLAGSILSLVMLVQVVKISQRIDSTSTFPAVKEIVFLAVLYVIIRFLILNSIDICAAVFDLFNEITKTIFDSADPDLSPITIPDGVGIGNMFIILIMALLLQLTGFVSVVIAWVMAAARAIQIYILAAFSPIGHHMDDVPYVDKYDHDGDYSWNSNNYLMGETVRRSYEAAAADGLDLDSEGRAAREVSAGLGDRADRQPDFAGRDL